MDFRKVTAIIRSNYFERVEDKLVRMRVKGMTVTHVMGFGEYANLFAKTWLTSHVRIEMFAEKKAKIVAISDSRGAVHSSRGIDPMKAIRYKDETLGADYVVDEIPAEMRAEAEEYRELLIEKCSEANDALLAWGTAVAGAARAREIVPVVAGLRHHQPELIHFA